MPLELNSPAFEQGAPIPGKFSRSGNNVPPPLTWSGVPERNTRELALLVDDPDAARSGPFVHWIAYNIPATLSGIAEGGNKGACLPIREGTNSSAISAMTVRHRRPGRPITTISSFTLSTGR